MLNTTFAASCIAIASLMVTDVNATDKWEKHGEKNGVTVFTSVEPMSEVPSVKAVAVISAKTEEVWSYITHSIHMEGLKMRKNLGSCGVGCEYVYLRLGNWMITDRHYVVKVKWTQQTVNGHTKYIRVWKKTADKNPIGPNAIVANSARGSWTLTPIANGTKTRITFVNHLDLGGNVPPSLFARGFVSNAYDIIANIKNNT